MSFIDGGGAAAPVIAIATIAAHARDTPPISHSPL
jgi:hypothetical protein